jgi:hypothetical protein
MSNVDMDGLGKLFEMLVGDEPDEKNVTGKACPICKGITARIVVRCPCGLSFEACCFCSARSRKEIEIPLREHEATCVNGPSIIKALGYAAYSKPPTEK